MVSLHIVQACILDLVWIDAPLLPLAIPPARQTQVPLSVADIFPDHMSYSNADSVSPQEDLKAMKDELFAKSSIDDASMTPAAAVDAPVKDSSPMQIASLETASSPSVSAPATKKLMARLCFIGWSEVYDEWIDMHVNAEDDDTPLSSIKIRPLNSYSCGLRGEAVVRDEVKYFSGFMTKPFPPLHVPRPNGQGTVVMAVVSRDDVIVSSFYVEVVQIFVDAEGLRPFLKQLQEFNQLPFTLEDGTIINNTATSMPVDMTIAQQRLYISYMCSVIICLSEISEILHKDVLQLMYEDCRRATSFVFQVLLINDLRTTAVETYEEILAAFESITCATFQNNQYASQVVTPIRLTLIYKCLHCAYLNRRLGGLKVLNDLIHRVEFWHQYPTGISITRSSSASSSPNLPRGLDQNIHYKVMSPIYAVPLDLCDWLIKKDIVTGLFRGDTAHEALMQRTRDILIFLLRYDKLSPDLLSIMWEVGMCQKVTEALQVICDLLPNMSMTLLQHLLQLSDNVEPSGVSSLVLDIVHGVALHCRGVLLNFARKETNIREVLETHNKAFLKLWSWGVDSSVVSDVVYGKCILRIEQLFELGLSATLVAEQGKDFPWALQWHRCAGVMNEAIMSLINKRSVTLSIKAIRAFIMSFLKDSVKVIDWPADVSGYDLPCQAPFRHLVADFIQHHTDILRTTCDVLLALKDQLCSFVQNGMLSDLDTGSNRVMGEMQLGTELQTVINDMMLFDSKDGYRIQLEACLDFFHFFVRCSLDRCIPLNVVRAIWSDVLLRSYTSQESDLVFSFLSRLIVVKGYFSGKSDSVTSDPSLVGANESKNTKRDHYCEDATDISTIFNDLLCSEEFITGFQFSASGLSCLEKFYRRISASQNYVVELTVTFYH